MIRLLLLPLLTLLVGHAISFGPSGLKAGKTAYPEHLTGAFTGGFGEETCHSCHFGSDINSDEGNLTVKGINKNISRGETVDLQVLIEREELGRGGFQMTARFEDSSQAGRFILKDNDDRLVETASVSDSLQYIQHSKIGSEPQESGKNSWTIRWRAPEDRSGLVVVNIAANAANGDQSEFGDLIFTQELELQVQ